MSEPTPTQSITPGHQPLRWGRVVSRLRSTARPRRLIALAKKQDVFVLFSLSSLILKVTAMVSSFVILRWVPPAAMGVWQTLLLIQSYSDLARLGVVRGMNRDLPFLLGKEKRTEALELAATAQAYALTIGGLGFLAFLAAVFTPGLSADEWRLGLICTAVIWLATSYTSYLQGTFRGGAEFKSLSYAQFTLAGLQVLSLLLVVKWGYGGMVVRAAVLAVSLAILLFFFRPIRIGPRLVWPKFRSLLATGLPLYGSAYLHTLALGFDRVILLQQSEMRTVGLYAPLAAVLTAMTTLPAALNTYIYPRMSFSLGKHDNPRRVWRTNMAAVAASILMSIPVAVVGWLCLPLAIGHIFPDYADALQPARVALISGVFLAGSTAQTSMVVLKSWRYLYLYTSLFMASKWIFPWILVQHLDPLNGIAIGGAIAGAVMLVVGIWTSYRATSQNLRRAGSESG